MPSPPGVARAFRFGNLELDATTGELRRGGLRVHLQDQPFRVLQALLERPGELLTREELCRVLWGDGTVVDFEAGLNNAMRRLRDALGDSAESPRFVETVARHGYRFIGTVEPVGGPERPAAPSARGAKRRLARLGLVLGAVLAVALAVAYVRERRPGHQGSPVRPVRIAVLPFQNLSGDRQQEYVSDGLTEETISELGRLQPAGLRVVARTTSMRYKGTAKTVAEVARELGADYVLEGSVRTAPDRVRVTVQLVRTSYQTSRWSTTLDRHLRDVLALQSDVAAFVADQVSLALTHEQRGRLARERPLDPQAFRLWLRGRYAWNKRTASDLREAVGHFEAAAGADPAFAAAHAGLADAWSLLPYYAGSPPREAFPKARAAALKAVRLDPLLAEAHTSLAYVAHRHDWDWPGAEKSYRRALALNPSYSTAHHWYAELLMVTSRLEEARTEMRLAQDLDPLSPRINLDVGLPDYFAGRHDLAIGRALRPGDGPGLRAGPCGPAERLRARRPLADRASHSSPWNSSRRAARPRWSTISCTLSQGAQLRRRRIACSSTSVVGPSSMSRISPIWVSNGMATSSWQAMPLMRSRARSSSVALNSSSSAPARNSTMAMTAATTATTTTTIAQSRFTGGGSSEQGSSMPSSEDSPVPLSDGGSVPRTRRSSLLPKRSVVSSSACKSCGKVCVPAHSREALTVSASMPWWPMAATSRCCGPADPRSRASASPATGVPWSIPAVRRSRNRALVPATAFRMRRCASCAALTTSLQRQRSSSPRGREGP